MLKTVQSVLVVLVGVLVSSMPAAWAEAADIPHSSNRYRSELVRNTRMLQGMDAPIADYAAQLMAESGFNEEAHSVVGAQGIAQFMPATAEWIGSVSPDLKDAQPKNPVWAIRALVTYDSWLLARVKGANVCERSAKAKSAYNGGLGWVYRDEVKAQQAGLDTSRWFGNVERVNAGRSQAAWQENRTYPRRILLTYAPLFVKAGWGSGVCV